MGFVILSEHLITCKKELTLSHFKWHHLIYLFFCFQPGLLDWWSELQDKRSGHWQSEDHDWQDEVPGSSLLWSGQSSVCVRSEFNKGQTRGQIGSNRKKLACGHVRFGAG